MAEPKDGILSGEVVEFIEGIRFVPDENKALRLVLNKENGISENGQEIDISEHVGKRISFRCAFYEDQGASTLHAYGVELLPPID